MPKDYRVEPGDCFESIAFETGFFSETLWKHSGNARLRAERDSPHVLKPGDTVHVPDLREKQETRQTDLVHRFVRRGVPSRFSVVLNKGGKPRAGVDYVLRAGKRRYEGKTGEDGRVEHWIDPAAQQAVLMLGPMERYEFALAHLLPVSADDGVRARLINLGFLDYPEKGKEDPRLFDDAVARFRLSQDLPADGGVDQAMRDLLRKLHGS